MLEGRHVELRALVPTDYGWIYALSVQPVISERWRNQLPGTLNPDSFGANLWNGVFCQFAIVGRTDRAPIGLAACYNADLRSGTAYIAVLTDILTARRAGPEGAFLFVEHLFATYPFRKLYGEGSDFSAEAFNYSIGRPLAEEGRLKHHILINGEYRDWVTWAIYREEWERLRQERALRRSAARKLLEEQ